jgi:cytochrome b involved in lipid metabolism
LLEEGAKDATDAFEDVGHSPDARDMLVKYYIGEVDPEVCAHYPDLCTRLYNQHLIV